MVPTGWMVKGAAALAALTGLWIGTATAQLVLPGAVAPTPEGTTQSPAPQRPHRTSPTSALSNGPAEKSGPKGTPVAIPTPATLVGKTLAHNGGDSQVTFGPAPDSGLSVSRLVLAGEKISDHRQQCRVEPPVAGLSVARLGKPDGLERLRLSGPACPLDFDILEGAILVSPIQTSCDFVEADCRVQAGGLWGPSPADLGPDRTKTLERTRAAADGAVRSNYKALVASTKDRPTIMGFARDQAQFSSSREETCRDYAEEGRHGYCAVKLTEARAALLFDRLGTALEEKAARKAKRRAGQRP